MRYSCMLMLLIAFASNLIYSKDLNNIQPSKVVLDFKGNDMELSLIKKGDDFWELTSTISLAGFFRRDEVALFKLTKDELIPFQWIRKERRFFRKKNYEVNFRKKWI